MFSFSLSELAATFVEFVERDFHATANVVNGAVVVSENGIIPYTGFVVFDGTDVHHEVFGVIGEPAVAGSLLAAAHRRLGALVDAFSTSEEYHEITGGE